MNEVKQIWRDEITDGLEGQVESFELTTVHPEVTKKLSNSYIYISVYLPWLASSLAGSWPRSAPCSAD